MNRLKDGVIVSVLPAFMLDSIVFRACNLKIEYTYLGIYPTKFHNYKLELIVIHLRSQIIEIYWVHHISIATEVNMNGLIEMSKLLLI